MKRGVYEAKKATGSMAGLGKAAFKLIGAGLIAGIALVAATDKAMTKLTAQDAKKVEEALEEADEETEE